MTQVPYLVKYKSSVTVQSSGAVVHCEVITLMDTKIAQNTSTVDQLMFAAINVRVLANQSISPAINVRDLGSQLIG